MPIPTNPYVLTFIDQASGRHCFLWGVGMLRALDKSLDGVVYLYFSDSGYLISLAGTQPIRRTLDVLFGAVQGYASSRFAYPPIPR
jgi:hypothetical protein